jgi:hypothetical protein
MTYERKRMRGLRLANIFAVPGTSVRGHGHFFRRPRSASVKRSLLAAFDTLRGVKVPPDSWDDISKSTYGHRTWKRHRRNQYHEVRS